MYPSTFFREKRLPIGASEAFKLCSLEWLRGPATPRKRHSLILPYRFELIRSLAA
jgi:hypothetical protein